MVVVDETYPPRLLRLACSTRSQPGRQTTTSRRYHIITIIINIIIKLNVINVPISCRKITLCFERKTGNVYVLNNPVLQSAFDDSSFVHGGGGGERGRKDRKKGGEEEAQSLKKSDR